MNPNTMTIDAICDFYAEREGYRKDAHVGWIKPDGFPLKDDAGEYIHPIPATLDEAAKLPEGWVWDCVERARNGKWWARAVRDGGQPLYTTASAERDTEMEARFPARLACTLADEGSST